MSRAVIDRVPDLDCVRSILRAQSVDALGQHDYGGSRRLTWKGLGSPNSVPTFAYKRGGTPYALQFHIEPDRPPEFWHYGMVKPPASSEVLAEMMDHLRVVADGLQHQCGVDELEERTQYTCRGNNCESAPQGA